MPIQADFIDRRSPERCANWRESRQRAASTHFPFLYYWYCSKGHDSPGGTVLFR